MRRLRSRRSFVLAIGVGVGSCLAAWATGSALAWHRSGSVMAELMRTGEPEARTSAAVVLHPEDCSTAWTFLGLLTGGAVRDRWPLTGLLLRADTTDGAWREALPTAFRGLPARRVGGRALRTLHALGALDRPTALLFEGGQLAAIERMPLSPRAYVDLGRRLNGREPIRALPR